MKVSVVAEGVETELQALLLRQFGCHAFQGYYFAKPKPLDAFIARSGTRRTSCPAEGVPLVTATSSSAQRLRQG
jgi:sensor c-di-GMP phosphodiesterase-like protein